MALVGIAFDVLLASASAFGGAVAALHVLRRIAVNLDQHGVVDVAAESALDRFKEGPGAFLGMTVVDATKKLLTNRRQTLSNTEIVSALEKGGVVLNSADKLNTVGSILMRRFNTHGDIVRVGRGIWGLQEWYGSRNFKKKGGKGDNGLEVSSDEPNEPEQPSEQQPNVPPETDVLS
jgi:hypothetical protein